MNINNSRVNLELNDVAALQNPLPLILENKVVPTIELNERLTRRVDVVGSSSTTTSASSTTILSAISTRKFVLCGANLSIAKDSTCDINGNSFSLACTIDGQSTAVNILRIPYITLTAERDSIVVSFNRPIKCALNTSITTGQGTFTVGTCVRNCTVWGYWE